MSTQKKQVLICYHAKCVDGLFAARNVFIHLDKDKFDAQYLAINYGSDEQLGYPNNLDIFDAIFFVDWCPTLPVLRTLLEDEDRDIVILDHHERAKNNLLEFPVQQYDNLKVVIADNLSGAGLVYALGDAINLWDHWVSMNEAGGFETVRTEEHIHLLTNMDISNHLDASRLDRITQIVQGRDLWLDGTEEKQQGLYLDAFLKHHNLVNTDPTKLDEALRQYGPLQMVIGSGRLIFETINQLCQLMLDNALHGYVNLADSKVNVIVGMCMPGYSSTFGELGYKNQKYPTIVVGIQPYTKEGKMELSFRCGEGVNVDVIAHDLFGGGGHIKASGARLETCVYNPRVILENIIHFIGLNPSKVCVTK